MKLLLYFFRAISRVFAAMLSFQVPKARTLWQPSLHHSRSRSSQIAATFVDGLYISLPPSGGVRGQVLENAQPRSRGSAFASSPREEVVRIA